MPFSRAKILHFRRLHHAKGRHQTGQFLVEGPLLVAEALRENWPLVEVILTREFASSAEGVLLLQKLSATPTAINYCSPGEMQRLSEADSPQGILASAPIPSSDNIMDEYSEVILICESISDPGNLGTILRTADWFGVKDVILGEGSADPFSPKAVRASAGAIFRIRCREEADLGALLSGEKKKGRSLYAAAAGGALRPENLPYTGRRALILGHEKRGVSSAIASLCDALVGIPALGRSESLNVTVAAGILLYCLTKRS